jgi:hypothetical protein
LSDERLGIHEVLLTSGPSINYYAPQIFKSVGLSGGSAGLFATGIYGIVKIVVTAVGLMVATEQLGRKWSLIIGGTGQAFAMFYIGQSEVNTTSQKLLLTSFQASTKPSTRSSKANRLTATQRLRSFASTSSSSSIPSDGVQFHSS